MPTKQLKIVPAYCKKCSDYLAGVPIDTSIYCPNCNIWTVVKMPKGKSKNIDYKDSKTITFERCEE